MLYVLSYSYIDREALGTFCVAIDGYVPFLRSEDEEDLLGVRVGLENSRKRLEL